MSSLIEEKEEEHAVAEQIQILGLEEEEDVEDFKSYSSETGESPHPYLDEVEAILNYKFKNKRLLEEALTDPSYSSSDYNYCCSNERLAYVGDSVLNLMITKDQYYSYPSLPPGSLTRLRAANVDTEKLARVAVSHGFHRYVRHKKPDLDKKIEEFITEIEEYQLHSNGLIKVPKILANIVESMIGAVFIDTKSSFDTTSMIFKSLLEPLITSETIKNHPMTELHERCQKRNLKLEFVDMWEKNMEIQVFIEEELVGRGSYGPKKEVAQNRAAKDALDNLDSLLTQINMI